MNAEPCPGQAKQHRLFGGDVRFDVGCVALRHIPYTVIHGAGRLAEYGYAAVGDGNQSEFGLHHGGFPGSVGADDGCHRALRDTEGAMLPDDVSAA